MNEKEIAEIRRTLSYEKNNISRIRGCFVNEKKEIVSKFDRSLGLMTEDETTGLLKLLRRTLSGAVGRNLIDIAFSNRQVQDSPEHKLLTSLVRSGLTDDAAFDKFLEKAVPNVQCPDQFLILTAFEAYDVPHFGKNGVKDGEAEETFSFVLCAVCPVKLTKQALGYTPGENPFRNLIANSVIAMPESGFMFPTFDNRTTNIYDALYYTKNVRDASDDFPKAIFNTEVPPPAVKQKETFSDLIADKVGKDCSLETVADLQAGLIEMVKEHKEMRERDTLTLDADGVSDLLKSCGVDEKQALGLKEAFKEEYGERYETVPQNLTDLKKLSIETSEITIKVDPDKSGLVETRRLNGIPYVLIRADGPVTVNGIRVHIPVEEGKNEE